MSRVGKVPVIIPPKVKAVVNDQKVMVEGPKGKVEKTFNQVVKISIDGNTIIVKPNDDSRIGRAMYGTARSIIAGMVKGVTDGFIKNLEIQGVGFKATLKGKVLDLALGYSHPILMQIPTGINVTVTENAAKNPIIKVEGVDKQMVGQVAAKIKSYYPVEPYKGKGVRIEGEHVRRKEGKKAG
ncbi:MAG: 50S ribosomal protein L6 [Verrucomicrobiota bacterium]|nr:50S ribosomal protein L6 [Verrucomicrobiota bacterium]